MEQLNCVIHNGIDLQGRDVLVTCHCDLLGLWDVLVTCPCDLPGS